MLGAVYREEQRRAARVAGTVDHREQESSREEDIRKWWFCQADWQVDVYQHWKQISQSTWRPNGEAHQDG